MRIPKICLFTFILVTICSDLIAQTASDNLNVEIIEHKWVSNAESDSLKRWIWVNYFGEDSTVMLVDSPFGFVIKSKRKNGWSLYPIFQKEYYVKMYNASIDTLDFTADQYPELVITFEHGDGHGDEFSAWSINQHYFLILDTANRKLLVNNTSKLESIDYFFSYQQESLLTEDEHLLQMKEEESRNGWSTDIELEPPCFIVKNLQFLSDDFDTSGFLEEGRYCVQNGYFKKEQ